MNFSNYSLKHFDKIYDTINHLLLENWYTYRTLALKIGTTANIDITNILSASIGTNFYIPVSEKEKKKDMVVNGLSAGEKREISSSSKTVNNTNNFSTNIRFQINLKISSRFFPSIFFEHGLAYIRNENAEDFLATQLNFGLSFKYQL